VRQANGGGGPPTLVGRLEGGLKKSSYIELKVTMIKGKGKNAPGKDGIGFEFFKAKWGALKYDILDLFLRCSPTVLSLNNRSVGL
jgi:hypothetical protein